MKLALTDLWSKISPNGHWEIKWRTTERFPYVDMDFGMKMVVASENEGSWHSVEDGKKYEKFQGFITSSVKGMFFSPCVLGSKGMWYLFTVTSRSKPSAGWRMEAWHYVQDGCLLMFSVSSKDQKSGGLYYDVVDFVKSVI